MMNYPTAMVYTGFFGLIVFSVWYTHEAWCLAALLLMPQYNESPGEKDE